MFGDGGWMGAGMWLFWILLIIVVLLLVKLMAGSGSSPPPERQDSPLEILKKRYASGEIDDGEFAHRRRELEK